MACQGPIVRSASGRWDTFCQTVRGFIESNVSEFDADGESVRGYRSPDTRPIWIRDHTHQLKAAKYVDADLKSVLDFFLRRQRADGSFYERVDPSGNLARIECEADVEYHFVRAVYLAWQATGDDTWMAARLDKLARGLRYCMTSPLRWSAEHGLIKRPFTLDTWDFQYIGPGQDHYLTKIDERSRFGVMHGDNSGLYESCRLLARMLRRVGERDRARQWTETAQMVRNRMNRVCWNGAYYIHFVHIDPIEVAGVDEDEILSLSNTYDINRGAPSHSMAVAIIDEYARRGRELDPKPFAPWFTVQPCLPGDGFGEFPHEFGDYRYINGGLMPFVGGELAQAALRHGREEFGVEQLDTYAAMLRDTGAAHFCYHYDGSPDLYRDTLTPHDGWGSAAMLYGLIEGLAGIEDWASQFRAIRLSPRWAAADEAWAEATAGYATGARFGYRYERDASKSKTRLILDGQATTARVDAHVLLPRGAAPQKVLFDGREIAYTVARIEDSVYVDAEILTGKGVLQVDYTV